MMAGLGKPSELKAAPSMWEELHEFVQNTCGITFTWAQAAFALTVAALGMNVLLLVSYSSQSELLRSQTEIIAQLKQDLRRRLTTQELRGLCAHLPR